MEAVNNSVTLNFSSTRVSVFLGQSTTVKVLASPLPPPPPRGLTPPVSPSTAISLLSTAQTAIHSPSHASAPSAPCAT
ncbi:hypothetical protein N7540_000990 [Penicillium herquei]|nr:hypothetical protein N7540_000990 [Penicillium herquei]